MIDILDVPCCLNSGLIKRQGGKNRSNQERVKSEIRIPRQDKKYIELIFLRDVEGHNYTSSE